MDFEKQFLAQDEYAAKREYMCCLNLLKIIRFRLDKGDLYTAEQRMIDFINSNHELKKLQDKKKRSVDEMTMILHARGESNEVLRRIMQEM